eukprot:TRINITY_DN4567_c0_g1_i1.p1 TRINITY_DN4567_c0_g1~~TRINITY_DN4567_c0_g1_i1.p1  ORF type:complete len:858 (+),score=94.87 TRINITY_DN4567_c0_g1_i1:142-2574(+)
MGGMRGAFERFMGLVYTHEDTPMDRTRKTIMFPFGVICAVIQLAFAMVRGYQRKWFWCTLNFLRFLLAFCSVAYISITKRCPIHLVEFVIIMAGFLFCIVGDFFGFGLEELWSPVVVIMDVLLLSKAHPMAAAGSCVFSLLYITVKTIEEGVGLGLYDMVPQSWVPGLKPRDKEGLNWTANVLFTRGGMLFADFIMTRNFAYGMRAEQEKSEAAVRLAEEIASALVKFDLDKASELVGDSADGLSNAFRDLLRNLRMYRPYLPSACFESMEACPPPDSRLAADAPGMTGGREVTIAFTDIQASTEIWDHHSTAMNAALNDHNMIMRQAIGLSDGYEVKTIGDAFMVSFCNSRDALLFALTAQVRLFEHAWPAGLLSHPTCKPSNAWNGLRVRIGVHKGIPRTETNPVTRRADYHGPMVNKAARVESLSVGGGILVTDEVLQGVTQEQLREDLNNPIVENVGRWVLKGMELQGAVLLYLLLPKELASRKHVLLQVLKDNRNSTPAAPQPQPRNLPSDPSAPSLRYACNGPAPPLKNRFSRSMSTILALRFDFTPLTACAKGSPLADDLFAMILHKVELTQGLLDTIYSGVAMLSWNASKGCPMHMVQALNFVVHMKNALAECESMWDGYLWFGVATGHVVHGTLGGMKLRVFTVMSNVVEIAVGLSDSARYLQTDCLLAGAGSVSPESDPTIRVHTRPIDTWADIPGLPPIIIYEFNTHTFRKTEGKFRLANSDTILPASWARRYKDLFAEGNAAQIALLSDDDPVLAKVAQLITGEMRLNRPMLSGLRVSETTPVSSWFDRGPDPLAAGW